MFNLIPGSKEHYCERFVTGTIGKLTWLGLPNGLLASGESRLTAVDHTCPDNAPLSPSITSRLPPLAIQPEETLELGYMPQRDDFERVSPDWILLYLCRLFSKQFLLAGLGT